MKIITFVFKSLWWVISGIFKFILNLFRKKPKYLLIKIETGEELKIYSEKELFETIIQYIPKYDKVEISDDGETILVTTFKNENEESIWECPNLDTMIDVIKNNDWGTYEYYIKRV